MKICNKCGGNNSDNEVYCDWCGDLLPNKDKLDFISFLDKYFHIFVIIGVFGAICYYIASFLDNPNNVLFLAESVFGVSLGFMLQIGLFISFAFIILLLTMLIFKIITLEKSLYSLKLLTILLIAFLTFTIFSFLIISINWLAIVVLVIVAFLIFAIYIHVYENFIQEGSDDREKRNRISILTGISFLILFCFAFFRGDITHTISIFQTISLPYEQSPIILGKISDGLFTGLVIGIFFGSVLYVAYSMAGFIQFTIQGGLKTIYSVILKYISSIILLIRNWVMHR